MSFRPSTFCTEIVKAGSRRMKIWCVRRMSRKMFSSIWATRLSMLVIAQGITWSVSKSDVILSTIPITNDGMSSENAPDAGRLGRGDFVVRGDPPVDERYRQQHRRGNREGEQARHEVGQDLQNLAGPQAVFTGFGEGAEKHQQDGEHADHEQKDADQLAQDVLLQQPHRRTFRPNDSSRVRTSDHSLGPPQIPAAPYLPTGALNAHQRMT